MYLTGTESQASVWQWFSASPAPSPVFNAAHPGTGSLSVTDTPTKGGLIAGCFQEMNSGNAELQNLILNKSLWKLLEISAISST